MLGAVPGNNDHHTQLWHNFFIMHNIPIKAEKATAYEKDELWVSHTPVLTPIEYVHMEEEYAKVRRRRSDESEKNS